VVGVIKPHEGSWDALGMTRDLEDPARVVDDGRVDATVEDHQRPPQIDDRRLGAAVA